MVEMALIELSVIGLSNWVACLLEGMAHTPLIMLSENVANENAQHYAQKKMLDIRNLLRKKHN